MGQRALNPPFSHPKIAIAMQTCLGLQKDSASMGVKINWSITTNN